MAPRVPYIDRITRHTIAPITTGQIYWGAISFVFIQIIMVVIVISFPQLVLHYKAGQPQVNPNAIEIVVPDFGGGTNSNVPELGLPGRGTG